MDSPAQSPDLKPIVCLWAIFRISIFQKLQKNKTELKAMMVEERDSINIAIFQKIAWCFKKMRLLIMKLMGELNEY